MAESTTRPFGPAPPATDRRIHLRILSPGQGIAETVDIHDVPLSITVDTLKQRIALVAPSHPPVPHQRLIFAGRVLADNGAKLSDALGDPSRTNDSLTIHMITRGPSGAPQSQPVTRTATPMQSAGGQTSGGAGTQTGANASVRADGRPHPPPGQQAQVPVSRQVPAPGQFHPMPGFPGIPLNPLPADFRGMPIHGAPGVALAQPAQTDQQNRAPGAASASPANGQQPYLGHQHHGQQQPHPAHVNPHEQMMAMMRQQHEMMHQAAHQAAILQAQGVQSQGPIVQRVHAQWRAGPGLQIQPGIHGIPALPGVVPGLPPQAHQLPQPSAGERTNNPATSSQAPDNQTQRTSASAPPAAVLGHAPPIEPRQQPPHVQQQAAHFYRPPFSAHMPGLLPSFIPPSQILAQNLANIQAQAQLLATPQTLYLLSSPTGPYALLYHNSQPYTANVPTASSSAPPAPPAPAAAQRPHPALAEAMAAMPPPLVPQAFPVPAAAAEPAQGAAAAAPAAAPGEADMLAPLQPLMAHFWLLFRILLFAYFFIGYDDGWRRPLALVGIALMFFGARAVGVGDGVRGRVRGWWDGVVGLGPGRGRNGQEGDEGGDQGNGEGGVGDAGLRQRAAGQEQALGPIRQRLRPVERALALFVASLWPGVGENTIRARREREQEEERRAREEREREETARIEPGPQSQVAVDGDAQQQGEYPRSVPINVGGEEGATGADAGPDSIAALEGEIRERRRREEGHEESTQ
ncbi:Acid phosphatase [Sphaceloma murrayae]|uniref:Acid phosphatase n=1 Tax=Sphaceloma murrayae TaxID=2082308 RepID=A0A2K1QQQ1_9PEZI|nr:Acid phosphatase [Sphaceloma murrayae]